MGFQRLNESNIYYALISIRSNRIKFIKKIKFILYLKVKKFILYLDQWFLESMFNIFLIFVQLIIIYIWICIFLLYTFSYYLEIIKHREVRWRISR